MPCHVRILLVWFNWQYMCTYASNMQLIFGHSNTMLFSPFKYNYYILQYTRGCSQSSTTVYRSRVRSLVSLCWCSSKRWLSWSIKHIGLRNSVKHICCNYNNRNVWKLFRQLWNCDHWDAVKSWYLKTMD